MKRFRDPALGQDTQNLLNSMYNKVYGIEDIEVTTMPGKLGWAVYADSQYTSAAPLKVSRSVPSNIRNDGMNAITSQEPENWALYDKVEGRIRARLNDCLVVSVEFTVDRTDGNTGEYDFFQWFDIGGANGEVYNSFMRCRGAQPRRLLFTTLMAADENLAENGAIPRLQASTQLYMWDIRYTIMRLYAA